MPVNIPYFGGCEILTAYLKAMLLKAFKHCRGGEYLDITLVRGDKVRKACTWEHTSVAVQLNNLACRFHELNNEFVAYLHVRKLGSLNFQGVAPIYGMCAIPYVSCSCDKCCYHKAHE